MFDRKRLPAGVMDLDETTAVCMVSAFFEIVGYKGVYSEAVMNELLVRFDICSTARLGTAVFLEPVKQLLDHTPHEGELAGRVKDIDLMLRVLREANGELRQELSRR